MPVDVDQSGVIIGNDRDGVGVDQCGVFIGSGVELKLAKLVPRHTANMLRTTDSEELAASATHTRWLSAARQTLLHSARSVVNVDRNLGLSPALVKSLG